MATVTISKIKFRRGLNWQRQSMVFDQGEPIFTTDTKRLFVGTGTLSGGTVIGSKIHNILSNQTSLTAMNSEIGDIVNANSKFWQLTANDYTNLGSWADVGAKLDGAVFGYTTDNRITLKTEAFAGTGVTTISALSSGTSTVVSLSSAGFLTFQGNLKTVQGTTVPRFAIPIYTY